MRWPPGPSRVPRGGAGHKYTDSFDFTNGNVKIFIAANDFTAGEVKNYILAEFFADY